MASGSYGGARGGGGRTRGGGAGRRTVTAAKGRRISGNYVAMNRSYRRQGATATIRSRDYYAF